MTTKPNLSAGPNTINWNGSIFLPATTVNSSGNQWLAWRLLVVDPSAFSLDSTISSGPWGPLDEGWAPICNEMFHTWPPLVLGLWTVRSVDGPRVRGIVLGRTMQVREWEVRPWLTQTKTCFRYWQSLKNAGLRFLRAASARRRSWFRWLFSSFG